MYFVGSFDNIIGITAVYNFEKTMNTNFKIKIKWRPVSICNQFVIVLLLFLVFHLNIFLLLLYCHDPTCIKNILFKILISCHGSRKRFKYYLFLISLQIKCNLENNLTTLEHKRNKTDIIIYILYSLEAHWSWYDIPVTVI